MGGLVDLVDSSREGERGDWYRNMRDAGDDSRSVTIIFRSRACTSPRGPAGVDDTADLVSIDLPDGIDTGRSILLGLVPTT